MPSGGLKPTLLMRATLARRFASIKESRVPRVSVILPTCDRPHLWPRALDSILRQTLTDFEVLLVDSNRRTPPVREHGAFAAARADPRVVLVEREHRPNGSAARNAGLAVARGEWITYLDDDDVYRPEKIAMQFARARETGAPMVLCGYTVNLPRRRRTRQVHTTEFCDDELLTDANWGTPFLFHRRDPKHEFDETLRAGHDEVFAHAFMSCHNVRRVPNCACSLVDVYPQVEAMRVHADGEAIWRAYRKNWRVARRRFSRRACRRYLAMGLLVRAQAGHGSFAHFTRRAWSAWTVRGQGAWRLVLNALLHRTGVFRRWVVS